MAKTRRILLVLLMAISFGFVSRNCEAKDTKKEVKEEKKEIVYDRASFKDIVEIKKITDTINLVQDVWVGEEQTSKQKLYAGAFNGIMKSLKDPYSEYYTEQEFKEQQEDIDGTYSGVGMSIQKKKGEYLEVISPFIGSPAYKANIQIGDFITKINGEDIADLTAVECSKKLKGPKGTKVDVEIVRKGKDDPIKVTLVRDEIKLDNVESKMLDDNIGYISLLKFGTGIANEIETEVEKLKNQGMKKLILDLRTNPGGSLNEAVDLASLFTSEELMVSLVRKNGDKKVYTRTKNQVFDGPMVLLTNKGSASASEIITGILKDYKRATVIGDKTYGKGVAQSIIPFPTGDAIKITIAKFETPKNNHIHKEGIEPDIYIEMDPLLSLKGYTNETKQAIDNRKKEMKKVLIEKHGDKKASEMINKGDTQLKAAVDFLNGKKVVSDKKEKEKK